MQAFDRALALEPALHEALFGRAEALRFAGRIDDAKAAYRLYLERAPGGRDAPVAKNALEALQ